MNVTTTTMTTATVAVAAAASTTAAATGALAAAAANFGVTTLADVLNGGSDLSSSTSLDDSKNMDDGSLNISPVTLSSDWSRVVRLLILASLAVVGSVGNVFMISAVMVEDHLKKRGKCGLWVEEWKNLVRIEEKNSH